MRARIPACFCVCVSVRGWRWVLFLCCQYVYFQRSCKHIGPVRVRRSKYPLLTVAAVNQTETRTPFHSLCTCLSMSKRTRKTAPGKTAKLWHTEKFIIFPFFSTRTYNSMFPQPAMVTTTTTSYHSLVTRPPFPLPPPPHHH